MRWFCIAAKFFYSVANKKADPHLGHSAFACILVINCEIVISSAGVCCTGCGKKLRQNYNTVQFFKMQCELRVRSWYLSRQNFIVVSFSSTLYNWCIRYCVWHIHCGLKIHPFSFHYSFCKWWQTSVIFGTHYTELMSQFATQNYWFAHLTYILLLHTTLQKKPVVKIKL